MPLKQRTPQQLDLSLLSILVVDDQPLIVTELCEFLESNGYRCVPCESGHQAIERFQQDMDIGLVLCDLHMPGLDGIQMVQELQRLSGKHRAFEAIMLTGHIVDGLTTQAKYYKPLVYEFFRKEWASRPSWGDYVVEIQMEHVGDAPWMDTQDLQFFWPGDRVSIRPIRVEAMFDGGPSGPELSDHDGFLVTYELSWPRDAARQPGGC